MEILNTHMSGANNPANNGFAGEATQSEKIANNQEQGDNAVPLHGQVYSEPRMTSAYFRRWVPFAAARYIPRGAKMAIDKFEKHGYEWTKEFGNEVEKAKLKLEDEKSLKPFDGKPTKLEYFKSKIPLQRWEIGYDVLLGAASLWLTTSFSNQIEGDIKNTFAEAIAYEKGKNPREITKEDLNNSDNKIVQDTMHNFKVKRNWRYFTDTLFFGRLPGLLPSKFLAPLAFIPWGGEIGIGAKAATLFTEMSSKKTTIFEDLIQFIDRKVGHMHGLGERVTSSDLMDIYQKYTVDRDANGHFKDITVKEKADAMDWQKAEPIFARMAELMNHSYKYKHSANSAEEAQNFLLPKFLYLLGHDMINPYKPEETMAYIEAANSLGMEAVKKLHMSIEHGADLDVLLTQFGINIDHAFKTVNIPSTYKANVETPAIASSSLAASSMLNTIPSPKIQDIVSHGRASNDDLHRLVSGMS